ncbi:MAG: hypothetical protein OEY33_05735 [Bdellovibrionales bacterium]|jgi:exopolyphosphatase/guanosine-5'-triphosphate,3'-diphosphate pyrophosphatase|nr:hypothetical protein [Bdellovibrionales bacterium]
MKKSSIDIGSNSILLLYGELNKSFNEMGNEAEVVGLGKGVDETGNFLNEKMDHAFKVLQRFREVLVSNGFDPLETIVTATEASRNAKNSKSFFLKVKNDLGFNVQIISPLGEAYYTSLGIINLKKELSSNECLLIDLGGASTEVIHLQKKPFLIKKMQSLKCGSVRATEWIEKNKYKKNLDHIFDSLDFNGPFDEAICIAGTFTTLASMYLKQKSFNPKEIEALNIELDDFSQFVKSIKDLDAYPTAISRKETIKNGGVWALDLLTRLNVKNISFSTFGLRYGVIFEGEIRQEHII